MFSNNIWHNFKSSVNIGEKRRKWRIYNKEMYPGWEVAALEKAGSESKPLTYDIF